MYLSVMLTPREDSSGAPFFKAFSRKKRERIARPLGHAKDSSSVGMTNKGKTMKILNLRVSKMGRIKTNKMAEKAAETKYLKLSGLEQSLLQKVIL
jgi:hypothetical protein